jgi:DNA invertase Pin-like site-specific DNA recombinase
MTALGYIRRSKESGQRTVSLETQAAAIHQYADANGLLLAEVLSDDGVSGGKRTRLVRIESAVRRHRARVVVVYHLDRFARDVAALLDTLRAYHRRGVELHVVGRGHVEVESEAGFLLTGVEGLMAEAFRRTVSRKTKDALKRLRSQGRRISRHIEYGYTLASDGLTLTEHPDEQRVLGLIRELGRTCSTRELARRLAEQGITSRGGKPFASSTLSVLLRRTAHNRAVVGTAA